MSEGMPDEGYAAGDDDEVIDLSSEELLLLLVPETHHTVALALLSGAVKAEREACAKIAEADVRTAAAIDKQYKPTWYVRAEQIAAAIRARSDAH